MKKRVKRVVLRSPGWGYLVAADPDGNNGRGAALWSDNPDSAIRFPSVEDALRLWQTQSSTRPRRPDGGVNRPLTAYHILLEVSEDAVDETTA